MDVTNNELTEFSNTNFSIIGRGLYIATSFEKTFRAYFAIIAFKYLPFFSENIREFSIFKGLNRFSLSTCEKVYKKCSNITLNRCIEIFFEEVLCLVDPENEVKFSNARKARNFIAHELCNFELNEIEKDSFRFFLETEMYEKVQNIVECILIMENAINEFNKEPILRDFDKRVNEICEWVIEDIS